MAGTYHHGNLRDAMIEEALLLTGSGNESDISLRRLAERLGVSRTAPYRHFKNKNALMSAVAARGFSLMRESFREFERSVTTERVIRNVMEDYVSFATGNPLLYRLMFSRTILQGEESDELRREITRTMDRLSGFFTEVEPGITSNSEVKTASWAMVHGISSLVNEKLVVLDERGTAGHSLVHQGREPSKEQLEEHIASVIHILAAGVTACSGTPGSTGGGTSRL